MAYIHLNGDRKDDKICGGRLYYLKNGEHGEGFSLVPLDLDGRDGEAEIADRSCSRRAEETKED